jgi:hypothetical protein
MLAVTLRAPLERIYGAAGYLQLRAALDDLVALAGAQAVALDDSSDMGAFGLPAMATSDAGAILLSLRMLQHEMVSPVSSLLLIGGDEVIPFWQITNPVTDRAIDPDPVVFTDNPYGAQNDTREQYLAPSMPVGRIVDPARNSLQAFTDQIKLAKDNRQQRPVRTGAAVVVNEQWAGFSHQAAAALPAPVDFHQAPGYLMDSSNFNDSDREILYFNLHGFSGTAEWKGFDPIRGQYVTVATPRSFDQRFIGGSVVFAENCYGAEIIRRNTRNSCALQVLQQGGALIGSTGLAFGSHLAPGMFLEDADLLASRFFTHRCARREELGAALQQARADYLANEDTPASDPFKQKTLLQFILLGDPGWN